MIKLPVPTLLFSLVALLSLNSTMQASEWEHITGETMGTNYQIRYASSTTSDYNQIKANSISLLLGINTELSTWDPGSWICEFNRAPANQAISVPPHAQRVLASSLEIATISQGVFSPAAYPLFQYWGFGPQSEANTGTQTVDTINQLKQLSDYRNLSLESGTLSKTDAAVHIDLSASAKGYGVDELAQILETYEITDYLVEIGGELRVSGKNRQGNPWRVGIETPDTFIGDAPVLNVSHASVATSGGSKVFKTIDGILRTHVIDLRSGYPLPGNHPVFSVTVIATECMLADSLATAAFVLDPEDSQELIKAYPHVGMVFILKDGTVTYIGEPSLQTTLQQ